MGYLINAWNETQKKFTMSLKQVVNIAGDESLESEEAVKELRGFFGLIDLPTMERLMIESYSKDKKLKFESRGFAFQDIINEMGIRLGYNVTHGLYRGKKGENGFDGLWKLPDGTYIIMEAKVTGDYAFSPETIIGYRERLIDEIGLSRKKCSILVVYGRDEKGTLRNSVKGSDGASNIRLISANALFQLVKTVTMSKTSSTSHQVYNLLRPREYFVLDNLVELVFPETDGVIEVVEDEENNPSIEDNTSNNTPKDNPSLSSEATNKTNNDPRTVVVPSLPNSPMKVGAFVYAAMQNLANAGFEFSSEDVASLCEEGSMKRIMGMQRSLPFFKRYDPNDKKGNYINDRPRYYNNPLKFGSVTVYINSQIYKTDREPFITWYESLGSKYKYKQEGAKSPENIPPLPDRSMKVGNFIRVAMENLAKSGFTFSEEEINEMCTENWMHDKIGMSRKIPFFKLYDPEDPKGNCINGVVRYYSKPLNFKNCKVYLTKELFAADKEPFILWYESLIKQ